MPSPDLGLGTLDSGLTTHLHCVVSAAYELVDRPADEIASMAAAEVRRAVPGARRAALVHARVVKEKRATFSARPGAERLRPTTTGAIGNLMLAGDWVDTGWPATMEGAVRSGYHAAAAVLGQRGGEAAGALRVADAPPGALYRWLAG